MMPSRQQPAKTWAERRRETPNKLSRLEAEGIDLSLLRERLKLSPTERLEAHRQALLSILSFAEEVQRARHRRDSHAPGSISR